MPVFAPIDWIAATAFVLSWAGYAWLVDYSPWRDRTLTAAMNRQRRVWMQQMLRRDIRIVDTAIIAGLQNGTAFFASTSLLAIGAAFALLTSADQGLTLFGHLPVALRTSAAAWEIKSLGLLAIYAYAFFKFGWSYRLFNYASILIGAVPPADEWDSAEAQAAIERAAEMNVLAGLHFTRGPAGLLLLRRIPWLVRERLALPRDHIGGRDRARATPVCAFHATPVPRGMTPHIERGR